MSIKSFLGLMFVIAIIGAISQPEDVKRVLGIEPELEAPVAANGNAPVIMYGAEWCGYCTRTRNFMNREGIQYTYYDIEKSSQAKRQYRDLGARGIPLTHIGDKVILGYKPDAIRTAVGRR